MLSDRSGCECRSERTTVPRESGVRSSTSPCLVDRSGRFVADAYEIRVPVSSTADAVRPPVAQQSTNEVRRIVHAGARLFETEIVNVAVVRTNEFVAGVGDRNRHRRVFVETTESLTLMVVLTGSTGWYTEASSMRDTVWWACW